MNEAAVRIALVAGALLVAGVVILYMRFRSRGRPVEIVDAGLESGVYLFTSSACQGCGSARKVLTHELGDRGFTELDWEQNPGEFHRLGVTAVPATLVVRPDGSSMLYPGQPDDALAAYDRGV